MAKRVITGDTFSLDPRTGEFRVVRCPLSPETGRYLRLLDALRADDARPVLAEMVGQGLTAGYFAADPNTGRSAAYMLDVVFSEVLPRVRPAGAEDLRRFCGDHLRDALLPAARSAHPAVAEALLSACDDPPAAAIRCLAARGDGMLPGRACALVAPHRVRVAFGAMIASGRYSPERLLELVPPELSHHVLDAAVNRGTPDQVVDLCTDLPAMKRPDAPRSAVAHDLAMAIRQIRLDIGKAAVEGLCNGRLPLQRR